MTIKQARQYGKSMLKLVNIETYALDADVLLMHILNIDKNYMLANVEKHIDDIAIAAFSSALLRRKCYEPIAYIVGKKEFMSLNFEVDKSVLIPRSDTEVLLELILSKEQTLGKTTKKAIEVGTGSGCIAVSLAHYMQNLDIIATDISPEAIKIATKNAQSHNVTNQVKFVCADIFGFDISYGKYDFIVSNPPYIPTNNISILQDDIKNYEPSLALNGSHDGLYFYKKITESLKGLLVKDGRIYYEIGHNQAMDVKKILLNNKFYDINIVKDLSGNDRVIYAKKI